MSPGSPTHEALSEPPSVVSKQSGTHVQQPCKARRVRAGASAEAVDAADVQKKGDGYVLASDASVPVQARAFKMSKSRGNVVNPDDIVYQYGADSLRLYEMFMGPLRETKVWSTQSVEGVHRFLTRVHRLFFDAGAPLSADQVLASRSPRAWTWDTPAGDACC